MTRDVGERHWADTSNLVAVALLAAAASYGHMYYVALVAAEPLWIARAFPLTVDLLIVAALRRGEAGRFWLVLGIAVSVTCNVLSQFPEVAAQAGPVVSAWPPIALYGTHRLLLRRPARPKPSAKPAVSLKPSTNGHADPYLPRVERIAEELGETPTYNRLCAELKIGRARAGKLIKQYEGRQ